jgi:two-component system cell cycle sensor histidine kinase/response regulator CckA
MTPAEALNTSPGSGKYVVMVVDDEPGIRDFLCAYLRSKNFKVICAGGGEEALELWRAERGKVDLLLTDVVMPGMNGKLLAEAMIATNPHLKIIFMSGYLPEEIAQETLDYTFFKKPFHPRELLEAIRNALH